MSVVALKYSEKSGKTRSILRFTILILELKIVDTMLLIDKNI